MAAFNTLLCASDAVYGIEFFFDLGWEFECRKSDAMASGYGCDDPMSLEITNSARSDGAVPGFIEQSVLNVRGKSVSEEGAAREFYYDIRGMDYATVAKIQRDDFRSRYLNFFEATKDSNASQVSSKKALCLLLMEFLPSFQTFSMGFLSGL